MKKLTLLVVILLLLGFSGCTEKNKNIDKESFYGTYSFEKVTYMSPLSSSSIDYVENNMADTKFLIDEELFKIEFTDNIFEVKNPKYMEGKIPVSQSLLDDVRSFIGDDVRSQVTIYTEHDNPTHWRLYISPDSLWISAYADNTADGSNIIMYIYKLTKND